MKNQLSAATWPAWAMLGIGLLVSLFVSLQVRQGIEKDATTQFAFDCDRVTIKIQERLGAYALILRGGAGLFSASDAVTRQEWRAYVEKLRAQVTVPGVQGIGFAQVIPPDQLASHIARIRAEGFPEYTVRPAGERPLYTAIIYLEPFRDRNLRAFGFDMFSEPIRRAAMEQARDSGDAALSGKVELVQETGKNVQAGTLMYVPVYRQGAAISTVDEKRAALIGWAYSPYRMNDLMGGILAGQTSQEGAQADLHIHDGPEATPATLLFDSRPAAEPQGMLQESRTIDFNGAHWLLVFNRADAAAGISYTPAWSALIGGFTLTALLFGLMLSVTNTRANAVRIAAELTRDVEEKSAQLNTIFALSPDGFISFDSKRRVKYVSPAFLRMTGLDEAQVTGLDEAEFSTILAGLCLPSARFRGVAAMLPRVEEASSSKPERESIELNGPAKRVLEVGLRLSDAETVSQILYFRDVTYEIEVERMKSEFLSTAAHELRTPMASIFGFAEVLLMQELDGETRHELLTIIYHQSELMAKVINELLDISRIEARRGKDFILATVAIEELVAEAISGYKVPPGREAPVMTPPAAPLSVRVDRNKIQQAVINLLSNAYKYSPGGGEISIEIRIGLRQAADSETHREVPQVGIAVRDHGIGMTPEQQARVFERFYRADTSGKILGTGLGMSIVKEFVELQGGQIAIESQPGVGTTVTLWLPLVNHGLEMA